MYACRLPFQHMNMYKGFILEVSSHQEDCDFMSNIAQQNTENSVVIVWH